jgi:hypothetical protein
MNLIIFFKKIYIIIQIIILFSYLYLTPLFSALFGKRMKKICFYNYEKQMNKTGKNISFNKLVRFNYFKIEKKINIWILNHTCQLDNLIISNRLENNNLSWNDVRSVSSIEHNIMDNILEKHGMFLVTGDLIKDANTFENLWKKWNNTKDIIQIILFPEGTIYDSNTKDREYTKSQKFILKNKLNIDKFNNLLFPNIGALNLIIDKLQNSIDSIYDFSISYKDKSNNRVFDELNILDKLAKNDLVVNVKVDRHNIKDVMKDKYWLFKIWKEKDLWIERN